MGEPVGVAGSLTATLGEMNPFRYRGYVWDEETELYYLISRYYCYQTMRFVNCDQLVVSGYGLGIHSFSYCRNSSIRYSDPDGRYKACQCEDDSSCFIIDCGSYGAFCVPACGLNYGNSNSLEQTKQNAFATIISNISNCFDKVGDTMNAFYNCISAEAGVGLGIGAEADVGIVFAGITIKDDLININSVGSSLFIGEVFEFSAEAGVGTPIKGLQENIGVTRRDTNPYICGTEEHGYSSNNTISFGMGAYLVLGFTLNVSFDVTEFNNRMTAVWGRE